MSALSKLLLYLLTVVLVAALLSPVLYWAIQGSADHAVIGSLAEHPFHRVFSRTLQVTAIVLLVPLLFWIKIRRVAQLGLVPDLRWKRHLALGLLLALVPVVILGAGYLLTDIFRVRKDLPLGGIVRILLTAGVVATIEEFLFRGVLLGLAVQAFGKWRALVGVSLLFAGVHFLRSGKELVETVTWLSGFQQLSTMGSGAPGAVLFFWGFLSLLVAGLILGWSALQTRSLWLSIGLHAGWICAQQGLTWLAKFRFKSPESLLPWVGPNLVSGAVPTGLAPFAALLLTGFLIVLYLRYEARSARLA